MKRRFSHWVRLGLLSLTAAAGAAADENKTPQQPVPMIITEGLAPDCGDGERASFSGTVQSVSAVENSVRILSSRAGMVRLEERVLKFQIARECKITDSQQNQINLRALPAGSPVTVEYTTLKSGTKVACAIGPSAPGGSQAGGCGGGSVYPGTVRSVSLTGYTITVRHAEADTRKSYPTDLPSTMMFAVNAGTRLATKTKADAKLSDFLPGSEVTVEFVKPDKRASLAVACSIIPR